MTQPIFRRECPRTISGISSQADGPKPGCNALQCAAFTKIFNGHTRPNHQNHTP